MENAQLVGLSRQVVLRRQMDLVANNLANLNTNGFKSQSLLMRETGLDKAAVNTFQRFDRPVSFVIDDANVYDLQPGRIEKTGDPLDVAIQGDGWFAVNTKNGERYTRNGSFALSTEGQLITRDGNAVQTDSGPITFDPGEKNITIAQDGTISTSVGNRGKLKVVTFANPGDVTKEGETLVAGRNPQPSTFPRIEQGSLERSNVNGVVEMTRMIEVTRSYEAVSTWLQSTNELRSQAIDALGQLN